MRITTDRRDPFAWLTRLVARLPAVAQRWAWFLAIYVVSVVVFGAVALFLNAIVPK